MTRSHVHLAADWNPDRATYRPACGWIVPVRCLTKNPDSVTCQRCQRSKLFQKLAAGAESTPEPLPGRRYEPDF